MIKPLRSASLALALLLPAAAYAQDSYGQAPGIDFELGLGAGVSPEYFGSSSYILSPVPVIRIQRLTLPNGRTFGGGPETGFSIGPSFDFIGERSAADHPVLTGLNTVDTAVELGVSATAVVVSMEAHSCAVLETRGLEYAKGLFHDNAVRVYNL